MHAHGLADRLLFLLGGRLVLPVLDPCTVCPQVCRLEVQTRCSLSDPCLAEPQQALCPSVQGISCTDSRPEVRNSGVRTLFSVVVSQGSKMSASMWDDCMWEILFPLLRSVHHMSVTSSREEVSCCWCLLSKVFAGHSTNLLWAACLARQQQPLSG